MNMYQVNVGGFIYFAKATSQEHAEQRVFEMLSNPNIKPSDLYELNN